MFFGIIGTEAVSASPICMGQRLSRALAGGSVSRDYRARHLKPQKKRAAMRRSAAVRSGTRKAFRRGAALVAGMKAGEKRRMRVRIRVIRGNGALVFLDGRNQRVS